MTDDVDKRQSQQRGLIPWQPGQSGNPSGRPKGARSKLAEAFLSDVLESWETNGKQAIADMLEKSPADYVKMAASLVPKEMTLNLNDNLSELSDDEVLGQLRDLAASLAPLLAAAQEGDGSENGAQVAARVH